MAKTRRPCTWRGPCGLVAELAARAPLRADDGYLVSDWAVAGYAMMLKSEVDVRAERRDWRLERVRPDRVHVRRRSTPCCPLRAF